MTTNLFRHGLPDWPIVFSGIVCDAHNDAMKRATITGRWGENREIHYEPGLEHTHLCVAEVARQMVVFLCRRARRARQMLWGPIPDPFDGCRIVRAK